MKKRILSMVLVVLLLCSMLSISALATNDPTVTVYITRNMFTPGGYDDDEGEPLLQDYVGGLPGTSNYFNSVLGYHSVKISDISSMKAYYGNPTTVPYTPNVLDAIIHVLTTTETEITTDPAGTTYVPVGGWDTYNTPNGGYISSFSPEGAPSYGPTSQETKDGVLYDVYTGTGWQVACTQSGTVKECRIYGTNFALYDGMVIVFDISNYVVYYPHYGA